VLGQFRIAEIYSVSDDSVAFIKPRMYDSIRYASPPYICDTAAGGLPLPIDWLFTVLRPAQEYFTYMETSPLPVKGYKI
jgi:hypothetical protein